MSDVERSRAYWGRVVPEAERDYHWITHPVTSAHLRKRISRRADVGAPGYWKEKFMPRRIGNALSLGCGFGGFERALMELDIVEHVIGIDVSHNAIESAKATAEQMGFGNRIEYIQTDLNAYAFSEGFHDAIFGISSVHHIFELESIFERCRRALKPGALLFLEEYVGPSRFQIPEAAMVVINSVSKSCQLGCG